MRLGPAPQDALVGVGSVPVKIVFDLGGQRSLHYPGGHDVYPHPPASEFGGQRPEHLQGSRLGRRVDALPRLDDLRPDAGEGDDATRASFGHAAAELADQAKGPLEVQIHHPIELLVRDLQQRLAHVYARRTHQYIRRPDLPDRRPNALSMAHVQFQGLPLATLRLYLLYGLLRALGVHIRAEDSRPEGGQPLRARRPDAAASPNHERALAGEVEHRAIIKHAFLLHDSSRQKYMAVAA